MGQLSLLGSHISIPITTKAQSRIEAKPTIWLTIKFIGYSDTMSSTSAMVVCHLQMTYQFRYRRSLSSNLLNGVNLPVAKGTIRGSFDTHIVKSFERVGNR